MKDKLKQFWSKNKAVINLILLGVGTAVITSVLMTCLFIYHGLI